MKALLVMCFSALFMADNIWLTDFTEAKKQAKEKHQPILLNFSGSDWCVPCIRMKKQYFSSESFQAYAGNNLVLLNADFPRRTRNKLSDQQQKQNDALAEQYNPSGKFPYTLLLDAEGKVLKTWEGCPDNAPAEFVQDIQSAAAKLP